MAPQFLSKNDYMTGRRSWLDIPDPSKANASRYESPNDDYRCIGEKLTEPQRTMWYQPKFTENILKLVLESYFLY